MIPQLFQPPQIFPKLSMPVANIDRWIDGRPITIVVVSDLHTGSIYAVMPREWKLMGTGHIVKASDCQLQLLDAYTNVVENWRGPDYLVVLGDAIDGQQPADRGTTTWSPNIHDQILACKDLLQMFQAKHIFVLRGTKYHNYWPIVDSEEMLARELNADFYDHEYREAGVRSGMRLLKSFEGITFNFTHYIKVPRSQINIPAALANELTKLLLERMAATREPMETCVDVRGHVHTNCHIKLANHHAFTVPSWQLQTPYMTEKSPIQILPNVGALRFTIEDNHLNYEDQLFPVTTPQPTEGFVP